MRLQPSVFQNGPSIHRVGARYHPDGTPDRDVLDFERVDGIGILGEACPTRTEQMILGNPNVFVLHFTIAAVVTHDLYIADDVVAGRIRRDDDHAEGVVVGNALLRPTHHRRIRSAVGAAREPLVTVDQPFAVLQHSSGLEPRGIGARDVRLRHREARKDLALEERLQIAIPPLLARELLEHDRVLQRMGAERDRRDL